MAKATTSGGGLSIIEGHSITLPTGGKISFKILPKITDSKDVIYSDEVIMGRSFPLKTFSHGGNRTIGIEIPFLIVSETDGGGASNAGSFPELKSVIRSLQALTYPQAATSTPFTPPSVCKLEFGPLLGDGGLCAVMRSYTMNYPSEVAWIDVSGGPLPANLPGAPPGDAQQSSSMPMYFTMTTQWEAVYKTTALPNSTTINIAGS